MPTQNSQFDPDRGHVELAHYLYWAWVAHREGILPETVRKRAKADGIPASMKHYFREMAKKTDRDASEILYSAIPVPLSEIDPKGKPS